MNSNYYKIYINKVFQLAQTLTIKSEATANGMNQYVALYYGAGAVDALYPKTWKYYLNISGQYHPTDTVMTVVSMDTVQEIVFSKETLAVHRATAREYAYGGRKYKELLARYPSQEMLILGILYPCDIDVAVAAKDGTILSYPTELVESNEYSLIARLQQWIDGYKTRWVNQQYGISDELYQAVSHGILYLNLVPAILTLRQDACKTNEAHSFHIQQYLASHDGLDVYLPHLTKRQALFLYRNIDYLERNAGRRETFDWLLEHIMSERGIPLAEYTMRHSLANQPDELLPDVRFRKKQINLDIGAVAPLTYDISQMLDKEYRAARDNRPYKDDYVHSTAELTENSLSNVVLTKVLESSMFDYSNSTPYTLESTLVNHWLFLSSKGLYNTYVGVNNPRTGERIPVSVKDAYVMMWYAFCRSINIELVEVPEFYAKRVCLLPRATAQELLTVVDSTVSQAQAQQLLDLQPLITTTISTEAFYRLCSEINTGENLQRVYYCQEEHQLKRAMVKNLVSRMYSDNIVRLEPAGKSYASWFTDRNIDTSGFTKDDFNKLYLELVKQATGLALTTTNSLKSLQAAMIGLLTRLSSYSVQYLTEINNIDIQLTDWTAVRVGDRPTMQRGLYPAPILIQGVQDHSLDMRGAASYNVGEVGVLDYQSPKLNAAWRLELDAQIQPNTLINRHHYHIDSAQIAPRLTQTLQTNSERVIPVLGIDQYLALSAQDRANVRDIWLL